MALPSTVLSPVMAYTPDGKLFVGNDQMIGFGFHCRPLAGGDDKTQAALRGLLEGGYPADSFMQIMLVASPNVVERRVRARAHFKTGDPLAAALMRRNVDWLLGHAEEPMEEVNQGWVREFEVLITFKTPIEGVVPTEAELDQAQQTAARIDRSLASLAMAPRRMTNRSFVTACAVLLNRGPHASWRRFGEVDADADTALNAQLLDLGSRMRFDETGVALEGGGHMAFLSPRSFGEHAYFGLSSALAGDLLKGGRSIQGPFWINLLIQFQSDSALKARIAKKRAWTVNMAGTSLRRWMPSIGTRFNDFESLSRAIEAGRLPVRFSLTLGVYGRDVEECDTAVTDAIHAWGGYNLIMLRDRYIARPLLINSLPLGADRKCAPDFGRYHTMTTQEVACFAPVFGAWRGTGTPSLTMIARNGQAMDFDLFDSQTNYNGVIAAEAGSGKSFLMQLLSTSALAQGAMVWTIDNGRSYASLCERLGGEYIDFKDELSLNPFRLIHDFASESELLVRMVATMAAPAEPLSHLQISSLQEVIQDVWNEYGHEMSVDLIARKLKSSADSRDIDLGRQLYSFTTQGSYGHHFAGENTISFSADYTVLELAALSKTPHLQMVVLQQLIYQIQQSMIALGRQRRTIMMIDEAWELLREGEIAKFIEGGYRRFRKEHGSMVIATQSLGDLYDSAVGRAIAENSANKILLGQQPEVIDRLIEANQLKLSPAHAELLKSVRSVRDQYSEAYFMTDHGAGVGRIVVDPGTRLLLSSHAPDVTALKRARDAGATLDQAIETVLADRHSVTRMAAE